MIKLETLVPKVYNNQSRDFQLLSSLYDLVLNSIKTNADLIYNCPLSDNSDQRLIDLMTLTLGFNSKHNYNIVQLTALCNAFAYIIRHKGSIEGIITACNTLVSSEGISKTIEYDISPDNTDLTLYVPQEISDVNLLKDLLVYILPAGMSCNIIKETRETRNAIAEVGFTQSVEPYSNENINSPENSWLFVPTTKDISDAFDTNNQGLLKDIPGIIGNTTIYKAPDQSENT